MSPEVAVASHAIAHVGAVQVPVFSGFAAPAVAQRLEASEAKVVITLRHVVAPRRRPCRCSRSSRRRSASRARRRDRRARAVRARRTTRARSPALEVDSRAPVPPHLHLRHDRRAEGRRARAGRLPRLDRARGRLPGRRARGRRHALRDRHGLDHGPVDGRRRRRARRRRSSSPRARPTGRRRTALGIGRAASASRRSGSRRRSRARCCRTARRAATSRRCARS